MGICLFVWCLGQGVVSAERVTVTSGIRYPARSERIFAYEFGSIVGGLVTQTTTTDAVFGGVLPLQINIPRGRLVIEGGIIVASATVPAGGGTHANFMARAQFRVTDRVAIVYWHWSNAEIGERNPALDSLGVTVRLRERRIRGLRPE